MSQFSELESSVQKRYGDGAKQVELALCCPVDYNKEYLKILPQEIIDRDYGCGDPSKYVKTGETVLDLGSGGGKICYIASQVVGSTGKVIGVDMTTEMLELANKYKDEIGEKLGYKNVEFKKGYIQDLKMNPTSLEKYMQANKIEKIEDFEKMQAFITDQKEKTPLIEDSSIDVIVSNCVLNLVKPDDKKAMFAEMFRVLKKGGRCVISDIVSDEITPDHLIKDDYLWCGCISGALEEHAFLKAFEDAGFHGIEILSYDDKAWQIIEGIEYRSMTVVAYKGKQGPCVERNQAVIYKGPWKAVIDDDGHTLYRGERMAVCDKTFNLYKSANYKSSIIAIDPKEAVAYEDAKSFDCSKDQRRNARESKGLEYTVTNLNEAPYCDPATGCC